MSRVEQAFKRVTVRKAILDDPAYDHLRQRQHAVVKSTGRGAKPKPEKTPTRGTRSVKAAMDAYVTPQTDRPFAELKKRGEDACS